MAGVVVGEHVDRSVPGQLGGVDEDRSADGVDLPGEAVNRGDHAGHVRRSGDGQQGNSVAVAGELGVEIVLVQRTVESRPDAHGGRSMPPRQQVGVVLEHGGQYDGVVRQGERPGELVDRLGGVLGEHDDVTLGSAPTKCPTASRASSNAAVLRRDLYPVPRCTLAANGKNCSDGVDHRTQRRCRRRVVQVHVTHHPPAEHRDELVHTDNVVSFHEPTVDDNRYPSATRRPEPAIRWRGADRLAGQLDVGRHSCRNDVAQLVVVDQRGRASPGRRGPPRRPRRRGGRRSRRAPASTTGRSRTAGSRRADPGDRASPAPARRAAVASSRSPRSTATRARAASASTTRYAELQALRPPSSPARSDSPASSACPAASWT